MRGDGGAADLLELRERDGEVRTRTADVDPQRCVALRCDDLDIVAADRHAGDGEDAACVGLRAQGEIGAGGGHRRTGDGLVRGGDGAGEDGRARLGERAGRAREDETENEGERAERLAATEGAGTESL